MGRSLLLFLFMALSASSGAVLLPVELRCEYLVNPPGIDTPAPRLAWVIQDSGRGIKQSACQIQVATNRDALDKNAPDVWDTDKTLSPQSVQVPYAGPALLSNQIYFWRVRVWDHNDRVSAWSATAQWQMGLLKPEDWKAKWITRTPPPASPAVEPAALDFDGAKWIGSPEGTDLNAPEGFRCYRGVFELGAEEKIAAARFAINVDDEFILYLNGHKVGEGMRKKFGRGFPATLLLRPGKNVIAVRAKNYGGEAGIICRLFLKKADGTERVISADAQWKTAVPFNKVEEETRDWRQVDFDDSAWKAARELGVYGMEPWGKFLISPTLPTQTEPSPLFRGDFQIAKPVLRATLHATGVGFHEMYLNGAKVGDHVLDPAFTRYDKRVLYATHDVTAQLKQGANTLGAMVGNGWYNVHAREEWDFEKAPWRSLPCMIAQLNVMYEDGTTEAFGTGPEWKTAAGPVLFDCIRNGECYDARREQPGWNSPGFEGAGWEAATVTEGPKGALRTQSMPPARVVSTIKPVAITEPLPGVFVADLGQNFSGWLRLKVTGPAGTTITLHYDERLTDTGLLDHANDIYVHTGAFQTESYTLKGGGEETWEPRFTYNGFRYVQIEGWPGKPTADNLTGCVVHTDFEQTGEFACSNDVLNKIWRATIWSYVSNFTGYPTDCPHREKNGWTGDAHLAANQAFYNFEPTAAYAKWMNDFADEQKDTGDYAAIIPSSGWGYNIGPSWDSAYLLIPWYAYLYRGDTRMMETHFDRFEKYLAFLGTKAKDGIVSYGLGDWVPAKTTTPAEITSTAYYYYDAHLLSKMAAVLGKPDKAAQYAALAESIRAAFLKKFLDPATGKIGPGTQTAQATALYQGLVSGDAAKPVLDRLVEGVNAYNNGAFDGGILGVKYIMHSLTNYGRHDVAYKLAARTEFPSWGHWMQQGATTLWENWNGELSQLHVMDGDVSAWFFSALAGIQPDPKQPGYQHIIFYPGPVPELDWVKAACPSPYGRIEASWKREGGSFSYTVRVPNNTTATVYLPKTSSETITESGRPLEDLRNIRVVATEKGRTALEIGAGLYLFEVHNYPTTFSDLFTKPSQLIHLFE